MTGWIALLWLAGYLIGGFPTGVVLSRNRYGIDVREMGSGNIGATNITRNFGWYAGLITLVADFLKGYLPVWWALRSPLFPPWAAMVLGLFLVLGHCCSPYLKFRGGKGVATSFGVLVAIFPMAAAIGAATYMIVLALTRVSAMGSLAAIAVVLGYTFFARPDRPVIGVVLGVAILVLWRHRWNIQKLLENLRKKRRSS